MEKPPYNHRKLSKALERIDDSIQGLQRGVTEALVYKADLEVFIQKHEDGDPKALYEYEPLKADHERTQVNITRIQEALGKALIEKAGLEALMRQHEEYRKWQIEHQKAEG